MFKEVNTLLLSDPSFYPIKIRTFTGAEYPLAVKANWQIRELKERVQYLVGVYSRVILWRGGPGGWQLYDDGRTLGEVMA